MTLQSRITDNEPTQIWDPKGYLAALDPDMLIIEQFASEIRADKRDARTAATLRGLNLGAVGRMSILARSPEVEGMIDSISHLVRICDRNKIRWDGFDRLRKASIRLERRRNSNSALVLQRQLKRFQGLSRDKEVGAALAAGKILAFVRKRQWLMESDRSARRGVADLKRTMYRAIFGDDQAEARQAAYCLVANSSHFGSGLDPHATATQLKHGEANRFRKGLLGLLKESGVSCFTSISAKVSDKTEGDFVIVEVSLRMDRVLPFTIDGKEVLLSGAPAQLRVDKDDFVIGCALAKRLVSVAFETESKRGTRLTAQAEFAVPPTVIERHRLPISVMLPGFLESRDVELSPGTADTE